MKNRMVMIGLFALGIGCRTPVATSSAVISAQPPTASAPACPKTEENPDAQRWQLDFARFVCDKDRCWKDALHDDMWYTVCSLDEARELIRSAKLCDQAPDRHIFVVLGNYTTVEEVIAGVYQVQSNPVLAQAEPPYNRVKLVCGTPPPFSAITR